MAIKEYEITDGRKAVFEYDENGVGKITLECMDMLMGQLIAYKRCIQSRSFWDSKRCDGCMFYDDCPFDPREDEDEPNSSENPNNSTISKMEQVDKDINVRSKDEPQTETEIAKAIVHKMIDDAVIAEDAYPDLRQKMHDAVDEYEPQTDYERASEQREHDILYEPTYNLDDGSM